ncbi:hypothetical protein CAP35_05330 [Chitinophagaceae bacterium IBVUCB1]|nr:hypothetical protein CAP35_05330 [Chitinophagaceae bacterium IBVUCB1]
MRLLIIILFIVHSIFVSGQGIQILGQIQDEETNNPILDAVVQFSNQSYKSDSSGFFKIKNNVIGKAYVSKAGYQKQYIELKEGWNIVKLRKEYINLSEISITANKRTTKEIINGAIARYVDNYLPTVALYSVQRTYLQQENDTLLFVVSQLIANTANGKRDKYAFYKQNNKSHIVSTNKIDINTYNNYVGNVRDVLETGMMDQLKMLANNITKYNSISSITINEENSFYDIVLITKSPEKISSPVNQIIGYSKANYYAANNEYVTMINILIDTKTFAVCEFHRFTILADNAASYKITNSRDDITNWKAHRDSTLYLTYYAKWEQDKSTKKYVPINEGYSDNAIFPFYKTNTDSFKRLVYHFTRKFSVISRTKLETKQTDIVHGIKNQLFDN